MVATANAFQHPLIGLPIAAYSGVAPNTHDEKFKEGYYHTGEDWAFTYKDYPVRAAANGLVVYAQHHHSTTGNVVIIQHTMPNGSIVSTVYMHLAAIPTAIVPNAEVTRGQVIGTIGTAVGKEIGLYTPHLHFEVYLGRLYTPGFGNSPVPDVNPTTEGYINPTWFLSQPGLAAGTKNIFGTNQGDIPGSTDDTGVKSMFGTSGSDYLSGLTGNDSISGLGGNDTLNGGLGNDTMLGGAGNDLYIVNTGSDRVFETTTTTNLVDAGGVDTVEASASWVLGNFVEHLFLTGSAPISGQGNNLNNTIIGNSANNQLSGMDGHDTLTGGGGKDDLRGGLGIDHFVYRNINESGISSLTRDVIWDFSVIGGDKINLSAIDANTLYPGNQGFSLTNSYAQSLLPGYVYFSGGILYGNVNGGPSDFQIQLVGVTSLPSSSVIP